LKIKSIKPNHLIERLTKRKNLRICRIILKKYFLKKMNTIK